MAIGIKQVQKFIQAHNSQGLASYLEQHIDDITTLLPPELFIKAISEFIASDARSMTNSYRIIQLLYQHLMNQNLYKKYQASAVHQNVLALFNVCNEIFQHKKLIGAYFEQFINTLGIDIRDIQAKFSLYEERQQLRSIYKTADDYIEKALIYKIKYPEGTHFLRRLLRIPPKLSSDEIRTQLINRLPQLIAELRNEFINNSQFKDKNGNFILTNAEFNMAIYERLAFKCSSQLGFSVYSVDAILAKQNNKQAKEIIAKIKKHPRTKSNAEALAKCFNDFIPPHLFDINLINQLKELIQADSLSNDVREVLKQTLNKTYLSIQQEIEAYHDKLGREEVLEKLLKQFIQIRKSLLYVPSYTNIILEEGAIVIPHAILGLKKNLKLDIDLKNFTLIDNIDLQVDQLVKKKLIKEERREDVTIKIQNYIKESVNLKLSEQLDSIQIGINNKVWDEHNKYKPKNKLTNFEKRAIEILKIANSGAALGNAEKKLLAQFFEYATGNRDFNARLTRIIKIDDDFAKNYQKEIMGDDESVGIYKYTYKSPMPEDVTHYIDKLGFIISNLEKNPQHVFANEQKMTLEEIGSLETFNQLADIIKVMKSQKLDEISPYIKRLTDTYYRCEKLLEQFGHKVDKQVSYTAGSLVVDVAVKYHAIYQHRNLRLIDRLQDWLTPYSHAAVGIGAQTVSHVWGDYQLEEKSYQQTLIVENFKIHPEKLIVSPEVAQKIATALRVEVGQLEGKLQEMYQKAALKMHNQADLSSAKIENNEGKRTQAGLADLIPWGHNDKESVRSWGDKVLHQKGNLGQRIKDGKGDYIICSEFAAKLTVLTLMQLEKDLVGRIAQREKGYKMPEGGLFNIPFHEKENLSKIHPYRLIKELQQHNAIEKMPDLPIVTQVIR